MKYEIGFIGCGNMAKAMIEGIISSHKLEAGKIIASDKNTPALEETKTSLGIDISGDNKEVAQNSKVVVLSVKPQFYDAVIDEIAALIEDQIVVCIAAGKSIENIEQRFGRDIKIIRAMPNTPALVCEGMTALCKNKSATDSELEHVCSLFGGFGRTEIITENLIDAVIAVSGSSPAYIFIMIEAMADAAVKEGLPREKAYKFAAQAVLGSAKMVLQTGLHPAVLKDNVCSPGGSTIEAVRILEEKGFRSSIMSAMAACAEKSRNM